MNYPLLLSLAYIFPLAFVVWLYVAKPLNFTVKLLLTVVLPLVYAIHWFGLQQHAGWPSDQTLPERFELISADVIEPNGLKQIEGAIHLWLRQEGSNQPRAYELPYSRALHKKLFETRQRMKQGHSQLGILYEAETTGKGVNLGSGQRLDFQDLAKGRLPPKT